MDLFDYELKLVEKIWQRSKPYKGEVSYSDMIKTALIELGGSGTQKEIGYVFGKRREMRSILTQICRDYIEEYFKQYLIKNNWRKAVRFHVCQIF